MKHIPELGALILGGALVTLAVASTVHAHSESKAIIAIYPNGRSLDRGAGPAAGWQTAGKRPLVFYRRDVNADLFTAPQPIPPAPLPTLPVVKPVIVEKQAPLPPSPDRFADYVYTGSVTIDGQREALIENSTSNEGWYVRPGDSFEGVSVTSIDAQSVTLTADGKTRLLTRSNVYNLVPLNAAARAEQPGKGGAGQSTPVQPGSSSAGQTAAEQPASGGPDRPGSPDGPGGPGGFGGPGGPGGFGGPDGPGRPGGFGGPPPQ